MNDCLPGTQQHDSHAFPLVGAQDGYPQPDGLNGGGPANDRRAKGFACGTCKKSFARSGDRLRHERIHSGVRPHMCNWPGCGKGFIQSSAVKVHARVHTGEKPHMCERCGKSFSDSSSLARHRRIHSGKRSYKCPYANCQKTFTRRPALTHHQNRHSGEEVAAAETNAKLSKCPTSDYDFLRRKLPPPALPDINPPLIPASGYWLPSITYHDSDYESPQPLEPPARNTQSDGMWWGLAGGGLASSRPVEGYPFLDYSTYGVSQYLYHPESNIRQP